MWELNFVPNDPGSRMFGTWVANTLAERTGLSKWLVDVVLTQCLWTVDFVSSGSNCGLVLDVVLKEVDVHGV